MRTINGRATADKIHGLSVAEQILGNNGNDLIYGGGGDDLIGGGNGNDILYGDLGNDVIKGGTGDDTLYGGLGNDKLTGEAGNDKLYGGDGNDAITETAGNNTVYGGNGDDTIAGGAGNDTASGDAGNDTVSGGAGDDTLYGGADDDILQGGAGNDNLYGGDGNDTLVDTAGIDVFNGGLGYDTVDYSTMKAVRGVDVFLMQGIGGHDAAGDTFSGIENVTGTALNDILWGNASDNVLNAGAGNDYLRGFGGDDVLTGGSGTDVLYGDDGDDTLRIGEGNDIAFGGNGYDWLDFTDTGALDIHYATDGVLGGTFTVAGPYTPFDGLTGTGDQVYDVEGLRGSALDDVLYFEGAPATTYTFNALDGGAGDDWLAGATRYYGGDGMDNIWLSRNPAVDKNGNPAPARNETVHLQFDQGIDRIAFFHAGEDKLEVSMSEFHLTGSVLGTNYDFVTTDSPTATSARASFIYETSSHILWFDTDGTGERAPVAIAHMFTGADAAQTDLIFVA
jgi:Ca2+-binding RTX toxin-like protein